MDIRSTELSTREAAVLDAVDAQWVVDRVVALVAVASLGGTAAESEAQHLVAGWLDELGTAVVRWAIDLSEAAAAPDAPGQEVERNEAWGVVGTLPGAEGGQPALVLCGHTDVVPAGDLALWPGDPFTPRVEDGEQTGDEHVRWHLLDEEGVGPTQHVPRGHQLGRLGPPAAQGRWGFFLHSPHYILNKTFRSAIRR